MTRFSTVHSGVRAASCGARVRKALGLLIPAWLLLGGCAGQDASTDTSALRINVTESAQTELSNVVSAALDGVAVTIADDALMNESALVLESGNNRSMNQPAGLGRNRTRPSHFHLIIDARRCFLIHEETGLRWLLADTECVAE